MKINVRLLKLPKHSKSRFLSTIAKAFGILNCEAEIIRFENSALATLFQEIRFESPLPHQLL